MKTFTQIEDLKVFIRQQKKDNKTIGFVPTMGYLHEGHLSLVAAAKKTCDIVIASIYVNPTQFGPNEDLDNYPRDYDGDAKKLSDGGVAACFYPDNNMMYPEGYMTYIEVQGDIVNTLCGAKREGHFRGVTTIVGKLFNIIKPDKAFFGMKDAQQVAVIKRMVSDLDFGVEIVPCPIVREPDGLAMSSRNKYLNKDARRQALALSSAIDLAKLKISSDNFDAHSVKTEMVKHINQYSLAKIDYVSIVDFKTLKDIDKIKGDVLIALAVYIDGTRLIDNAHLEV